MHDSAQSAAASVAARLEQQRQLVSPVQRALRLLRHIADGDPVSVPSRTAKDIGINRTTLGRLLATLEDEGMIERRRDSAGYALGAGIRRLCASALFGASVVQIADPLLIRLTAEFGLSSHLAELEGHSVVYLLRHVPNMRLVSNVQIGTRLEAHLVNAGRIILAFLPHERLLSLYKGLRLERVTDQTPANLESLVAQLHRDRELGLAWSDSSFESGVSSVAAPVFDHTGAVIASVNVTGPSSAFEGVQRRELIAAAVRQAAWDISQQLGADAALLPGFAP
jgi:DNA-binding IclR family transcriptional regulator